jgi:hypothetical protein
MDGYAINDMAMIVELELARQAAERREVRAVRDRAMKERRTASRRRAVARRRRAARRT